MDKRFIAGALMAMCMVMGGVVTVSADEQETKKPSSVTVHGSLQTDILFPESDYKIGTNEYSDKILTNTYASATLVSKYVDAGLRFEYLEHPLPGYEAFTGFKGWGVPHIYAKFKFKGFELTGGDFYEQFGSGFILRTYEERSLGIDNSIRGGRLKVNALPGFRFTALGGVQRRFWEWSTKQQLYGADVEWDAQQYIGAFRDKDINWTFGASYVLRHEDDQDIVTGNYKLNLPKNVSAFDVRTQFYKSGLSLLAEYAWKGQDPSYYNHYTYRHGSALMLSASYSKSGWSALLQAKRSDNMDFRTRRAEEEAASFINNMPPFTYQHTYALAAMYPYATQAAPGEWAFQTALAYTFKRGTAMGGKYGTKFKLNASYICGLQRRPVDADENNLKGTDWWETSGGLKLGQTYYTDVNLQMEKKITRDFNLNAMYMFQKYNQKVIEQHGSMVTAHVFVVDGKIKLSKKFTLRVEGQYMLNASKDGKVESDYPTYESYREDKAYHSDWLYGLAELSWAPYLMFSVSDQWNVGGTGIHYYMANITANYRNNRLMVGYGRTRAGFNCSGGVCRYVPATRGFQMSYSFNF